MPDMNTTNTSTGHNTESPAYREEDGHSFLDDRGFKEREVELPPATDEERERLGLLMPAYCGNCAYYQRWGIYRTRFGLLESEKPKRGAGRPGKDAPKPKACRPCQELGVAATAQACHLFLPYYGNTIPPEEGERSQVAPLTPEQARHFSPQVLYQGRKARESCVANWAELSLLKAGLIPEAVYWVNLHGEDCVDSYKCFYSLAANSVNVLVSSVPPDTRKGFSNLQQMNEFSRQSIFLLTKSALMTQEAWDKKRQNLVDAGKIKLPPRAKFAPGYSPSSSQAKPKFPSGPSEKAVTLGAPDLS